MNLLDIMAAAKIRELGCNENSETAHLLADAVLVKVLKEVGCNETAVEFQTLTKMGRKND